MVVQPASPGEMKKPLAPTLVEVSASTHHSHFSSGGCWSHSGYSSNAGNHDETFQYDFSVATDSDDMLECLLNLPDIDNTASHPLDFQALALAQAQDAELQHKLQTDPARYMRRIFDTRVYLIDFVSPTVA